MGRSTDTSSAARAIAVTPSDATILQTTRGLYIGTTGTVVVRMTDGVIATFNTVPVGILQVQVTQVMAATAASNILALY